jgi:hypothetical protein
MSTTNKAATLAKRETALATILPVDRHALNNTHATWQNILEAYAALPCGTLEEEDMWADWMNAAHIAAKILETERKGLTGPIDKELKTIAGYFTHAAAPALAFKELASTKIAAARGARQLAAKAAVDEARLAAQAGDTDAVYAALAVSAAGSEKVAGTSARQELTFSVVDISQVPRAFLCLDERLVKAHLKANPTDSIPGIEHSFNTKIQPAGVRK